MNILMIDTSPIPYTPETPYIEPLGGSETAFTLLARGLEQLGHKVILLNNTYQPWRSESGNLLVTHHKFFPSIFPHANVVLANRTLFGLDAAVQAGKPFYYWSHDAYDQTHIVGWMGDANTRKQVTRILCVSEWQRRTFNCYFGVPLEQMTVVGDPIDYALYAHPRPELNSKVFVFASIPYKGLEFLVPLWLDIYHEAKDDELKLLVLSSMKLYHTPHEDEKYREVLATLASCAGVEVRDVVSMRELVRYLSVAGFYLHPSTYHETFGLVVMQHMALGGLPIAPSHGALPEVTQGAGLLSAYPNIWDKRCYDEIVTTAVRAARGEITDLRRRRARARRIARDYDYVKIAKRVEREILSASGNLT